MIEGLKYVIRKGRSYYGIRGNKMHLRDEIRNYKVTTALSPELIKTSREYKALAVLKYSFPERFSKLQKSEAPDLQEPDGELAVEVTWGGSPRDALISGESVKYSHAKTKAEKERIRRKIRKNGGDRDDISTSYPVGTSGGDKKNVIEAFRKKLKKVDNYRQSFLRIGLAIIIDIPLFLIDDSDWGNWLSDINNDRFEFVALIHWSGVDIYDFKTGEYSKQRISREDMDALKRLGRMAAEGKIKDDDPVWEV